MERVKPSTVDAFTAAPPISEMVAKLLQLRCAGLKKVKASRTRYRALAVNLQVTVSHPPGGRLPLLSARPAVTSPAAQHDRPLAGTKLYCLVTEAHRCKQLA